MPIISHTPTVFGPYGTDVGMFNAVRLDLLNFDEGAIRLTQLALYLESEEIPLRAVARIARDDMEKRFQDEEDPDHDGWFELLPDYAERKEREVGSKPILEHGGRGSQHLKKKALKLSNFIVAGDSVVYDTSELPEYWRVHQEGSSDFGSVFHAKANTDPNADSSVGKGYQNIPPRPFIGMSKEAEAESMELFDLWFSNGIGMATKSFGVHTSGKLMHRKGGRFTHQVNMDNPFDE